MIDGHTVRNGLSIIACCLVVLLSSCSLDKADHGASSAPTANDSSSKSAIAFEDSANDSWQITIERLQGKLGQCDQDPVILSSIMSADLPASRHSFTLAADASEEQAIQLAKCFLTQIDGGSITVYRPAS